MAETAFHRNLARNAFLPVVNQDDVQAFWLSRARRAVRKVNFAWYLEKGFPLLVAISLVTALSIVVTRSFGIDLPLTQLALFFGPLFGVVLVVSWLLAKSHFETLHDGLVRIEASMGLNNSLTTAFNGHGNWPIPLESTRDGISWRWQNLIAPLSIAVLLLGGAPFFPLAQASKRLPPSKPLTWEKMEQQLELLEEESLVTEQDLESWNERLMSLAARPQDEWFSHNTMEATDTLAADFNAAMEESEQEMLEAASFLEELADTDLTSETLRQKSAEQFAQTISGLEKAELSLPSDLLNQLKQLDPEQLRNLTEEQKQKLRELQQDLRQKADGLQGIRQPANGGLNNEGGGQNAESELDRLIEEFNKNSQNQEQNGEGQSGEGQGAGKGGIDRGPGTAPITLSEEESRVDSTRAEGVRNEDLSNALPSEVIDTVRGEHEVDPNAAELIPGGAIDAIGDGGDAIWREQLLPREKEILKRYFK